MTGIRAKCANQPGVASNVLSGSCRAEVVGIDRERDGPNCPVVGRRWTDRSTQFEEIT